jgi:hypothetical protein
MDKNKLTTLTKGELFLRHYSKYFLWRIQDKIEGALNGPAETSTVHDIKDHDSLKKSWEENGFIILKSETSPEKVDLISEEIARIRKYLLSKYLLSRKQREGEFGETGRMLNTHILSRTILKFILDQRVRNFLISIFNAEPVVTVSGAFLVGTEQSLHSDGNQGPTAPMVTAHTALEDVHPDSGPVYYYEKSHLKFLTFQDFLNKHPNLKQRTLESSARKTNIISQADRELVDELYNTYQKEVISYWENSGSKKVPILINKGDTIIWNNWLLHGGLKRIDPKITRKSIVRHYFSKNCNRWLFQHCWLNSDRLLEVPPEKLHIEHSPYGLYLRHYISEIYYSY